MTAVIDNIENVAERILPDSRVRWNCLPPAFKKHCLKQIAETLFVWENNNDSQFSRAQWVHGGYLLAKIPLSQNYFKILKFFTSFERHISWKDAKVETEHFKPLENPIECTNRVVKEWWTQQKPSDELREFMVKLVVVQSFKKTAESDFIGSSEFRDVYFSLIPKLTPVLPSFAEWATQSTTFAQCKKALGELGIPQARRAEGQRFTNLKLVECVNGNGDGVNDDPEMNSYLISGELLSADAYDSGFDSVSGYSQSLLDAQFVDKSDEIREIWINDIEARLHTAKMAKEKYGDSYSLYIVSNITELETKKQRLLSKPNMCTNTVWVRFANLVGTNRTCA